jgi:hypothetical protein
LKENANEEELTKAKENAKSSGGEIKHEFSLIKGFTCVPHLATSTLAVADWFVGSSSLMTKSASFRPMTTFMSSRTAKSRPSE